MIKSFSSSMYVCTYSLVFLYGNLKETKVNGKKQMSSSFEGNELAWQEDKAAGASLSCNILRFPILRIFNVQYACHFRNEISAIFIHCCCKFLFDFFFYLRNKKICFPKNCFFMAEYEYLQSNVLIFSFLIQLISKVTLKWKELCNWNDNISECIVM